MFIVVLKSVKGQLKDDRLLGDRPGTISRRVLLKGGPGD